MSLYKEYENKKPIGSYTFSNNTSVLFFEDESHEKDFVCCFASEERWDFRRYTIFTTVSRSYVRFHGIRIYMDEVMRV